MRYLTPEKMQPGDVERAKRVKAICDEREWPFPGLIDLDYMPAGLQPNNCQVLRYGQQMASVFIPRTDRKGQKL